ncbi:MAG: hypothetical protein IT379_28305, partial [Deltaproteobacteria bacterium]|nr:hypothetical protein [Deltaproteobacteria bacterium]
FVLWACGDDDGAPADAGPELDAAGDGDAPMDATARDADASEPPDGGDGDEGTADAGPDEDAASAGPPWCAICRRDEECGEGRLCLVLDDGERGCGTPCETDADCGDLAAPAACVEELPGFGLQCRPQRATCVISPVGSPCDEARCDGRYDVCADFGLDGLLCTQSCRSDADCPLSFRRCRAIDGAGAVCIPDDPIPRDACVALIEAGRVERCVGEDRTCPAGLRCYGADDLALCLESPAAGADCPEDTVERTGPSNERVCVPVRATPDGWERVLPDCACVLPQPGTLLDITVLSIRRTRCSMTWEPAILDAFGPAVAHDPYRLSWTDRVHRDWPAAVRFGAHVAESFDGAAGDPQHPVSESLRHAARFLDLDVSVAPAEAVPLADAIGAFVRAAGGEPDEAAIGREVEALDARVASRVAPIVDALRRAHEAREAALAPLGADRDRWLHVATAMLMGDLPGRDLRRSEVQGALRGDVDLRAMAEAAANLARAVEDASLDELAGTSGALTVETPVGRIAVRGGGDDRYEGDAWSNVALLIDLGGDDTYLAPVGATVGTTTGVALVVDVAGSDRYGYVERPHPRDDGGAGSTRLPSDADARLDVDPGPSGDGPRSLSRTPRQGAGVLGIGLSMDLGPERDTYRSLRMSQGFGALGVGVLYDAGGDDTYEAEAAAQGSASFGIGLLLDRAGNDDHSAYAFAQGFAYVRAVGVLHDDGGDDTYYVSPGDALYFSPQDPGRSNTSMSQGAGFGRRGDGDGFYMSGGLGVLRDVSGDDDYTASIFAQATGYWFGSGYLLDGGGADEYDARWYAQAGAAHFAVAVLDEASGDDRYNLGATPMNAMLGAGHDFSIAWLVDRDGADQYVAPNLALGAGNAGGTGIFGDAHGIDRTSPATAFSRGNASVETPGDPARRASGTIGIFLDADGTDLYEGPGAGIFIGDEMQWSQVVNSTTENEVGFGVDRAATGLGF